MKVDLIFQKLERPLRVAHVGNIANNAYLAAKYQRRLGIEAHVFSPDYVHVMGFPEWEECFFERRSNLGHFDSDFPEVDFEKPTWFHWGSWESIFKKFALDNQSPISADTSVPFFYRFTNQMAYRFWKFSRPFLKSIIPAKFKAWAVNNVLIQFRRPGAVPARLLLNSFDLIHFYGPYNSLTALIKLDPAFITTEHGTLRDYIFSNYTQAKMSKIGYLNSSVVIITNQDSYPSAIKLGLVSEKILLAPHPINEDNLKQFNVERLEFSPKIYNVLIPARQIRKSNIETGKGNDQILVAIKKSIDSGLPCKFLIPLWGDDVETSLELARDLGIMESIDWLPLLSRPELQNLMNSCIAVIDQLNVRAYGAVGADALALGVPLITAAGLENDDFAFGSRAPVFDAIDSDSIYNHLLEITGPDFNFNNHALKSQLWYKLHLSMDISTSRSLDSYLLALKI